PAGFDAIQLHRYGRQYFDYAASSFQCRSNTAYRSRYLERGAISEPWRYPTAGDRPKQEYSRPAHAGRRSEHFGWFIPVAGFQVVERDPWVGGHAGAGERSLWRYAQR